MLRISKYLSPLYIILHHLPLPSIASTPGTLALFLDEECIQASIINPSVNLPVDTCLVTRGALGIAVKTSPPCVSGLASLVLYEDTSCARVDDTNIQYNNCYFNGPNGVSAVVFACKDAGGAVAATSTSTVSAGSSSLPVAVGTPEATPSNGSRLPNTPASNGASATSSPSSSSTVSNPPQSNTHSGGNDSGGGSGGSGLSQKWQIVIGVVVPVGAIVVALLAWCFPCNKRQG